MDVTKLGREPGRFGAPVVIRTVIFLVLTAIAVHLGHTTRAVLFGSLTVASVVIAVWLPQVDRALLRGLERFSTWVGDVLGWVAAVVIEVVIVLPGRLITTVRRRDPISNRPKSQTSTTWRVSLDGQDRHFRPYAPEVPGRTSPRLLMRRVAVIAVLIVVVPNIVSRDRTDDPSATGPVTQLRPQVESVPDHPTLSAATVRSSPAMADAGWRDHYADELGDLAYDHRFYVVAQPRDRSGPLLTVKDHRRETLEPDVDGATDVPTVWLLGGSTAFGFAQRDDHTIASDLVRRSEAAGRPIRVVNLGVPGAVAFQDALVLERALAHLPRPDLVVAYEGANDVLVQDAYPSPQPTTFPFSVDIGRDDGDNRSFTGHWADASLVAQMLPGHPGHEPKLELGGETEVPPRYDGPPPAEAAADALDVLDRSNALARRTAERYGVPIVFVAQPALAYGRTAIGPDFLRGLTKGRVDLTDSLEGHDDVYLDDVQINEEGAAIVAKALFDEISDNPALGGR